MNVPLVAGPGPLEGGPNGSPGPAMEETESFDVCLSVSLGGQSAETPAGDGVSCGLAGCPTGFVPVGPNFPPVVTEEDLTEALPPESPFPQDVATPDAVIVPEMPSLDEQDEVPILSGDEEPLTKDPRSKETPPAMVLMALIPVPPTIVTEPTVPIGTSVVAEGIVEKIDSSASVPSNPTVPMERLEDNNPLPLMLPEQTPVETPPMNENEPVLEATGVVRPLAADGDEKTLTGEMMVEPPMSRPEFETFQSGNETSGSNAHGKETKDKGAKIKSQVSLNPKDNRGDMESPSSPTGFKKMFDSVVGKDVQHAPLEAISTASSPSPASAAAGSENVEPSAVHRSPPADAVTPSPVEWAKQIHVHLQSGRSVVHVQLHPEHLGEMRIAMEAQGKDVRMEFTVDNDGARQAVTSGLKELTGSLSTLGWNVGGLAVNVASGGLAGGRSDSDGSRWVGTQGPFNIQRPEDTAKVKAASAPQRRGRVDLVA